MNAIYELFTRNEGRPTVKAIYRAGVAVGLVITVYLCWEILFQWPHVALLGAQQYQTILSYTSSMPIWVTGLAAVETTKIARRIDWTNLATAPLTRAETTWAFVRGNLFHSRLILAMTLAILPMIPLGWLENRIELVYQYANCAEECRLIDSIDFYPYGWMYSDHDLETSLVFWAIGLGILASSVAASCIGVFFALVGRRTFFALPMGAITTVMCLFIPSLPILNLFTGAFEGLEAIQIRSLAMSIAALNIVGFAAYIATRTVVLKRYMRIPG